MASIRRFFRGGFTAFIIISALVFVAGCLGLKRGAVKSGDTGFGDTFEVSMGDLKCPEPDNCTKCHFAWLQRFDYFHGWDRYGYVFSDRSVMGFYDPWSRPELANRYREYYETEWWKSAENNPWPGFVATRAESMSILSRPGGMPVIPRSQADIKGPVIVVAKSGGDYDSIGKAVKKANAGTTVFVRPGEYNETVALKDGVSLIGEDPATTIINPKNAGHAIHAANHSIIAGFTITGTGIVYQTKAFNCGVYVAGAIDSTCIIAGNIIRENGLFGVWLDGAPAKAKEKSLRARLGGLGIETADIPYENYPNPVICGNTFYRVGQRAVFCVHARGEIFNNIFSGNVKAVGMERHSRPYIHHNICWFNNVPMAVNTSEPVIAHNIFEKNQWGQRMIRGANPVMFANVTWNSPHFRDFDEYGIPRPYLPHPGMGERSFDPCFADPLAGDFSFRPESPLVDKTTGFEATGIMRDAGLPQPPKVTAKNSWGREVLSMNDEIVSLIGRIEGENAKIRGIRASYTITYKNFLKITPDRYGDPAAYAVEPEDTPVVSVVYSVPKWSLAGGVRTKTYRETRTSAGATVEESGTIVFKDGVLTISDASPNAPSLPAPDLQFVGERPQREKPGGFYRDYDQFYNAAAGPLGTFLPGLLRIMGGIILEKPVDVDGHSCIVVRYPHIGKDQYFEFFLDPSIGWRPRKIVQYFNTVPCRVMDGYVYKPFANGVFLPVKATVTDYAILAPCTGKKAAVWQLTVDEKSLAVGGE